MQYHRRIGSFNCSFTDLYLRYAMSDAVPWETALMICAEIRQENRKKKLSFISPQAMQCRGCETFSKGDPKKMCIANGCNLVNARYRKQ